MVRAVEGGSPDLHSMVGRLNDGILLCMKATAEFMAFSRRDAQFLAEATDVKAVFQFRRGTVVTCRQDLFIFNKDGPHLSS
jgi:hypothetical protein